MRNLAIGRCGVLVVACAALIWASESYWTWKPVELVAAVGILVICVPVDMALKLEIRARRSVSPFRPVRKFGVSEDAIHSHRITARPRRPWWWRLWRRITNPVAIAALPLALIPVGLAAAPDAAALTMSQHVTVTVTWTGAPLCIYAHHADPDGSGVVEQTSLCSEIQVYRATVLAIPGRWVGVDPEMSGADTMSCTLQTGGETILRSTATRGDGTEVTCLATW